MYKNRSQHYNFAFESIPIMFHSQTEHFVEYIGRDGLKFLEFWWEHMGVRLDDSQASDFEGMAFEIRKIGEKKSSVILITLPRPKNFGEAYTMALIEMPKKRFPVHLSNTRVFVLEYVSQEKSATGTFFGELTPRGRYLPIEPGPGTDLESFYQKVLTTTWKR